MIKLILYVPLFVILYIITSFFIHKLKNLPPTPFLCFPIIGHIYLLKKPLHRTLTTLSEAYGPAFYLKLGYQSVLVVSSQTAAKHCLSQNGLFSDRLQTVVGNFVGLTNAKLLSALPQGQDWVALRRILTSSVIYSGGMHLFSSARQEEVKALIRRLFTQCEQSSIEKGNDNSQVIDMKKLFHELTYRVIIRVLAGEEWLNGENGERFGKVLEKLVKLGKSTNIVTNYVPFLRVFGYEGQMGKIFVRLHGELDRILQNLIDEKKSDISIVDDDECEKTMIHVMLSLQRKDPVLYSDKIIKDLVLVLLIVGTDTCSTSMEWAISLLLNNPRTLHQAQSEIDEHVDHNRLINEQDRLSYVKCIIQETLRMYPAGPLLIPHDTPKGYITEGGFRVPPGTLLLINTWAIHNNPKFWVAPREFKPERFEDGNMLGYKFMDFGSRTSQSTVEVLAINMVELILGSILQCFDLEIDGENSVDMEEAAFLTMTKAKPLEVRVRPRSVMLELISRI